MPEPMPERRSRTRRSVELPVRLRRSDGTEQNGLTRDLSASGIFLYSEARLEVGSRLEMVITMPPGLGIGPGGWALCQASVVRVEKTDGKGIGVAAVLDRIELMPEIGG